jgi:hypothetical protein
MFRRRLLFVSVVSLAAVRLAGQSGCNVTPEVTDSHTALLDHFDGSTIGQVTGSVTFGPSVNGLNSALQFASGSWVEYSLNGWYKWSSTYDPSIAYGAIELWVKAGNTHAAGTFLAINWYDSAIPQSSGYITELGLDSSGRLTFAGWSSVTSNPYDTPFIQPHTTIPQTSFTHISYTWSPTGTAVYVNGNLEATSSLNYYPALNSTVYVYLNPWGSNVLAAVDELRVSTIARAEMMSCVQ